MTIVVFVIILVKVYFQIQKLSFLDFFKLMLAVLIFISARIFYNYYLQKGTGKHWAGHWILHRFPRAWSKILVISSDNVFRHKCMTRFLYATVCIMIAILNTVSCPTQGIINVRFFQGICFCSSLRCSLIRGVYPPSQIRCEKQDFEKLLQEIEIIQIKFGKCSYFTQLMI